MARKQTQRFDAIASRFKNFQQAREVLTLVRAVPTVLVDFDHATGVGGFPIERISVMHGPSSGGKTLAALALIRSFLQGGHFVLHIDAEWATPGDWVASVLGPCVQSERFFAMRPTSFEEVRDQVKVLLAELIVLKKEGKVPSETSALVVIDSIKKLRPKRLLDNMLKDEGGIDGMNGRAAQYKAALNAQWLDELVPLLGESGAAALLLARESEDPNASAMAKQYGTDYKVLGGKAVIYDSSLVMRVERAKWVTKGEKEDREVLGELHRITINKTKIAGKDDKTVVCYFHSSNGKAAPFGLDPARDLLLLGKRLGVVEGDGMLTFGRTKWRGVHNAAAAIAGDEGLMRALDSAVRAAFANSAPIEIDASTGEVS